MINTENDILLLKLIKEDDKSAFKYLFQKYIDSICQYIDLLIHDVSSSEDLALDLFTAIWENRKELDIKQSFKSYLFQAARNKALTYIRDKKEYLSIDEVFALNDTDEDCASKAEFNELYHLIEEAVMLLPEKCQEIFRKSRDEDMTNKEIAAALQISEKTVENQITIALRKIKCYLNENYN